MIQLKHWFNVFVYSNWIIALAAVAQCALTYLVLDITPEPFILIIEWSSTLLLYNFSLFLSKPRSAQDSPYERIRWFFRHITLMWYISLAAVAFLCYSLFHIHVHALFFLLFIGLLSLLYHVPLIRFGPVKGGLRQIPGLKLFYIAAIWSLSTVGLPVIQAWSHSIDVNWYQVIYLGGIKVLFITICTLPFDIRDMKQDRYYNLKTIPNIIGKNPSIGLNYFLLSAHSVLLFFAPYTLSIKSGMLLMNLFIAILFYTIIFRKSHQHYNNVYLLDLCLIVQYILVYLIYSFCT